MNTLFKTVTGSHLYGTNTPTSDIDYAGVFIADKEFYFWLQKVEELDLWYVSKLDNGKNASDAVDFKMYELRNYVKLALQNNPNILELLFTNQATDVSDLWNELLSIRKLFPHMWCVKTYIWYANSQRHKMTIRTDKHDDLVKFMETFNGKTWLLIDYRDELKESGEFFVVGDINIPRASTINAARDMVKKRYEMFSNRKELISKHWFDSKFWSHLIRLLLEWKELIETWEIQFPLQYADIILDIKQWNWSLERLLEYADNLEKEIYAIVDSWKSPLPSKPRYDEVNNWLINTTYNNFYNVKGN